MDEIFKIVLDRNKKRKVLSKNDIKRICEIIIGSNKFIYNPKICFEKTTPYEDGSYAVATLDAVTFYLESLSEAQQSKYENITNNDVLDGTKVDYYNYIILDTIFHEFAHIAQFDSIEKGRNSIDTKLFSICKKLQSIKEFYDENYSTFISEINAYFKGLINSYLVYEKMPSDIITDNDKRIYASNATDILLSEYYVDSNSDNVKSPSEILLSSAEDYNLSKFDIDADQFRRLVFEPKDMTLYKKLSLGLPLTFQEAAYVHLLATCVSNGQKVNFVKKLQRKL